MQAPTLEFVLRGGFDLSAADRLRQKIASVDVDQPVVVDFTRLGSGSISALATFITDLSRLPRRRLLLRGLRSHERVLLRYCGVDLRALGFGDDQPSA